MAHGLRVRGNSSIALIDGTYQNFALRHHGFIYVGSAVNSPVKPNWRATLTLPADTPVLAIRSNYPTLVESVERSGGSVTYRLVSIVGPATVEYYVFDRPNYAVPVGSNYGLRVRDSGGNITYDSRMRYMKIIDGRSAAYEFSQYAESMNDTINYEATYPGVKIAIVQVVRPWNHLTVITNPGPNPNLMEFLLSGTIVNNNDSHVKVIRETYAGAMHENGSSTPIAPDSNNAFCYSYQTIDVTGY